MKDKLSGNMELDPKGTQTQRGVWQSLGGNWQWATGAARWWPGAADSVLLFGVSQYWHTQSVSAGTWENQIWKAVQSKTQTHSGRKVSQSGRTETQGDPRYQRKPGYWAGNEETGVRSKGWSSDLNWRLETSQGRNRLVPGDPRHSE